MATKDVRVRLSAEGQQEIISAFRRIQEESVKTKQSAQDAGKGFDALKQAAHSVAVEFLGYEVALRAFEGIKTAIESSIDLATNMEKLEQKTGLSAETLQVFSVAAKRLNIEQESVNKGLGLFAKTMGALDTGSQKAANAVKQLFGSADALKGLNTDQRLLKVTDALSKMEAGGKKAYLATQLMGRGGLELLPILDELGGKGFENTKKKLEALGVAMSEDFVTNAHRAEQAMADLKLAGQGIATQFTAGFAPALADIAEGFAGAGSKGSSAMKEFGESAGKALKTIILLLGGTIIGLQEVGNKAIAVGKVIWDAINPLGQKVKPLPQLWAGLKDDWKAAGDNAKLQIDALGNIVADKVEEASKKISSKSADVTGAELSARAKAALAKANLEFQKAKSDEELAIYKEANRIAVEDEQARWKRGEESVSAYYQNRERLAKEAAVQVQRGIAEEIAQQETALKSTADPAQRVNIQKTISELKTKAHIEEMKSAEEQNKLVREQADEYNKLAEEVLGFQAKIQEAQGKGHAIEIAAIEREADKYRKDLLQLGDANVDAKVSEFEKVLKAQASFKTAEKDAEDAMRQLDLARKNIELSAEAGLISEAEKKRQLAKLDKDRIPELEKQLALMRQIAAESGLPQLITQTDEWALKIRETQLETEKLGHASKDATKILAQGLGKDLNSFFTKGIFQAKSFGDSMRGLALSVTQSFQQMFTQLLMKMLQAKLMAASTAGGGGGFLGFLSGVMNPSGKAEGGEIHGPGSGTSDSVPIWASTGEYVVKAAAVSKPGVRDLLHLINSGLTTPPLAGSKGPRFAAGGEVATGGMVLGGNRGGAAALTVGLDYGLVIKNLEAHPNFGRVVVRHLSENRKAANAALGR
jgi:hypothetical protein